MTFLFKTLFSSVYLTNFLSNFSNYTYGFLQEVEHFLCLSHEHDAAPEFRLEGLKFLNSKLTQESAEINTLLEGKHFRSLE